MDEFSKRYFYSQWNIVLAEDGEDAMKIIETACYHFDVITIDYNSNSDDNLLSGGNAASNVKCCSKSLCCNTYINIY